MTFCLLQFFQLQGIHLESWVRKFRCFENLHLHGTIPPAADDFVGDKVDAIYLVRVTRKICLDLICFEIPNL
jgi:hypothetical protein